jgi:TetR/AcrR family transcriptional regulator
MRLPASDSAITAHCLPFGKHPVHECRTIWSVAEATTRDRILDAALLGFGTRGYEATALDTIAVELGVRKQTILYWFASKEALLDAVLERGAIELAGVFEAALASGEIGVDRIESVMRAVFRYAVRRPQLLGLLREVERLGPTTATELSSRLQPLIDRAVRSVDLLMQAKVIREGDPRLMLSFLYSTILGVATDVQAQRAFGVPSSPAGLRRLRRELFAFVRAAVIA